MHGEHRPSSCCVQCYTVLKAQSPDNRQIYARPPMDPEKIRQAEFMEAKLAVTRTRESKNRRYRGQDTEGT